jgi:hypothetical protein
LHFDKQGYLALKATMMHTRGTSDFDAQMCGIKILKGDEIPRAVYRKKHFPKYCVVACIFGPYEIKTFFL